MYSCNVTHNQILLGIVTQKDMLLYSYEIHSDDSMETNVLSMDTHKDKQNAAWMFSIYDLTPLLVVDGENRQVGTITIDDAMDIMEEKTTEDIEKMTAILPADKPYIQTRVIETCKHGTLLAAADDTFRYLNRYDLVLL